METLQICCITTAVVWNALFGRADEKNGHFRRRHFHCEMQSSTAVVGSRTHTQTVRKATYLPLETATTQKRSFRLPVLALLSVYRCIYTSNLTPRNARNLSDNDWGIGYIGRQWRGKFGSINSRAFIWIRRRDSLTWGTAIQKTRPCWCFQIKATWWVICTTGSFEN